MVVKSVACVKDRTDKRGTIAMFEVRSKSTCGDVDDDEGGSR